MNFRQFYGRMRKKVYKNAIEMHFLVMVLVIGDFYLQLFSIVNILS